MKQGSIVLLGIVACVIFSACTDSGESGGLAQINKTVSCSKPYIPSGQSCCLDIDASGVCDSFEQGGRQTPSTSAETAETRPSPSTTFPPTCEDRKQNGDETGTDCGGSCRPCRSPCESLINMTAVKPAARTTMLCLTSKDQAEYMGYLFSVQKTGSGLDITAYDPNGSLKRTELSSDADMSIDGIALRLIGQTRKGGTTYVWLYAWVPEEGIVCSTNSDCGNNEVSSFACVNNQIILKLYHTYRCINPGTIFSECRAQQNQEQHRVCDASERCVSGDDRCFPKECFDSISNKDEEGTDCGGSCRPCHCFNAVKDAGELGADCGGPCRPCLGNSTKDMSEPKIQIHSPKNEVYSSRRIDLNYSASEPVEWCRYSVNGRANITIARNGTLYADKGANKVTLYCADASGNVGVATQEFTVSPRQTMICDMDNVSNRYTEHFDSAFLFTDSSRELGVAEKCNPRIMGYALTYVKDTGPHHISEDASEKMSDGAYDAPAVLLRYDCRASASLEAGYAVLEKDLQGEAYSALKAVLYFSEESPKSTENSFWRVYAYGAQADEPDSSRYVDIPYRPIESACGKDLGVYYQELDLTSLLPGDAQLLRLRLGFYSQNPAQAISLREAELFLEPA